MTTRLPPEIFKAYDIRGIVGKTLTPDIVRAIGQVLGTLALERDCKEIVVGRDGLIISRGPYAGLLLPQVATEYGWDRQTFLEQTCRKAGLPPDAWRAQDCRIEKFSAIVFGE